MIKKLGVKNMSNEPDPKVVGVLFPIAGAAYIGVDIYNRVTGRHADVDTLSHSNESNLAVEVVNKSTPLLDFFSNPMVYGTAGAVIATVALIGVATHYAIQHKNKAMNETQQTIAKALRTIEPMLKYSGYDLNIRVTNDVKPKQFKELIQDIQDATTYFESRGVTQASRFAIILGLKSKDRQGTLSLHDVGQIMMEGFDIIGEKGPPQVTINKLIDTPFERIDDVFKVKEKHAESGYSLS